MAYAFMSTHNFFVKITAKAYDIISVLYSSKAIIMSTASVVCILCR